MERLAAGYAVAVIIQAAVCARNEMLNGGFGFRECLAAEEALAALGEQQSVKMSGHSERLGYTENTESIALGSRVSLVGKTLETEGEKKPQRFNSCGFGVQVVPDIAS
jgi:hypothetical protein